MRFKTSPVIVKAAGTEDGLAEGEFTGYAAVFGNIDSYGDKIAKGAFTKTLEDYPDGAGIPSYWSHRMDDPDFNIGKTVKAAEDDHGLFVHVALDLDSPKGAYVHKLIKEGRVGQMSFAYDVVDAGPVKDDDGEYFELRELRLHEVSVVPVGANQETELMAVKAAASDPELIMRAAALISTQKLGRAISAKTESKVDDIVALAEQISDLARQIKDSVATDETVSDEEPDEGNDEDPETGKSEDRSEVKARNDVQSEAAQKIQLLKGK